MQKNLLLSSYLARMKISIKCLLDYILITLSRKFHETYEAFDYDGYFWDDFYSDAYIIYEQVVRVKQYPCHKLMLSMVSPVINQMLRFSHTDDIKIKVTEDPSAIKKLLHYIYTRQIQSKSFDLQLLIAADKYDMKNLKNTCE